MVPHVAALGESVPVRLQLYDGWSVLGTKYPRAYVYTASGALEATLDLSHVALGLYGYAGGYEAPSVGRRVIRFEVFSNAARTVLDGTYPIVAAEVAVSADASFADEEPGAAARAHVQLFEAVSNQYPRMRLYDAAGAVVVTADAAHVAGGLYRASFTAPAAGWYTAQWTTYSDALYATPSGTYGQIAEAFKTGVSLFPARVWAGGGALVLDGGGGPDLVLS